MSNFLSSNDQDMHSKVMEHENGGFFSFNANLHFFGFDLSLFKI